AELRQDLHARAVLVRVLRALRAGVSDRRDHHDEVVRSGRGRSPRPLARQGPVARAGPDVRAFLGHRQPIARHAGAPQAGPGRGARGGQGRREGAGRVTPETVGFWVVAVVVPASSLAVVLPPNLFHAVLFLAAALVAPGVVFLLLDQPFLFAVQLLLYAGGVVTIVVFAIMLTERLVGDRLVQTRRHLLNRAIGSAAGL